MRNFVPPLLIASTLLIAACNQDDAPKAAGTAVPPAAERRIPELENRLNAIEQMVRTLDRRDDRLADMAISNAGARTPSPRPTNNNAETGNELRTLNADIDRLSRRFDSVSEQLTAIVEGLQQIGEENNELRTTLADHEQALERIISGN